MGRHVVNYHKRRVSGRLSVCMAWIYIVFAFEDNMPLGCFSSFEPAREAVDAMLTPCCIIRSRLDAPCLQDIANVYERQPG